jgi:hypothetical protein
VSCDVALTPLPLAALPLTTLLTSDIERYFKYARLFARDFIDKTLRQTPTTTLLVGVADVLRSAVG